MTSKRHVAKPPRRCAEIGCKREALQTKCSKHSDWTQFLPPRSSGPRITAPRTARRTDRTFLPSSIAAPIPTPPPPHHPPPPTQQPLHHPPPPPTQQTVAPRNSGPPPRNPGPELIPVPPPPGADPSSRHFIAYNLSRVSLPFSGDSTGQAVIAAHNAYLRNTTTNNAGSSSSFPPTASRVTTVVSTSVVPFQTLPPEYRPAQPGSREEPIAIDDEDTNANNTTAPVAHRWQQQQQQHNGPPPMDQAGEEGGGGVWSNPPYNTLNGGGTGTRVQIPENLDIPNGGISRSGGPPQYINIPNGGFHYVRPSQNNNIPNNLNLVQAPPPPPPPPPESINIPNGANYIQQPVQSIHILPSQVNHHLRPPPETRIYRPSVDVTRVSSLLNYSRSPIQSIAQAPEDFDEEICDWDLQPSSVAPVQHDHHSTTKIPQDNNISSHPTPTLTDESTLSHMTSEPNHIAETPVDNNDGGEMTYTLPTHPKPASKNPDITFVKSATSPAAAAEVAIPPPNPFDSVAFDKQLYKQTADHLTRDRIEDQRRYLYINPAIHMVHHRSAEWHKAKITQIQQRKSRKHWFGKVSARKAWIATQVSNPSVTEPGSTETRQDPQPWIYSRPRDFSDVQQEDLPDFVLQNPEWAAACAWLRETAAERKDVNHDGESLSRVMKKHKG